MAYCEKTQEWTRQYGVTPETYEAKKPEVMAQIQKEYDEQLRQEREAIAEKHRQAIKDRDDAIAEYQRKAFDRVASRVLFGGAKCQ